MINECNIVRDLLPIYADKATTSDSDKFVKKHLSNCEGCQKYYKSVTNRSLVANKINERPLAHYEIVAKKLKKRTVIKRILITSGFVIAAAFCVITYLKNKPFKKD